MSCEIANMTIADYEEAVGLWRRTENVGLNDADSRESIDSFLRHNAGLSFVARRDGRLVGAVLCGTDGRRGLLHHLAVDADHRGRGIGRALVERCLAALKSSGIEKCHIYVYADNAHGRAFWKQMGWYPRDDLLMMSFDIA
jgi:ribosomal protein S18 acetylase RimI-like enzyme